MQGPSRASWLCRRFEFDNVRRCDEAIVRFPYLLRVAAIEQIALANAAAGRIDRSLKPRGWGDDPILVLAREQSDVALPCIKLPGIDGREALRYVR